MSIRVLVADDQSMVRAGFRMLLSGEPDIEVVAEASNGIEAVHKAARFRPTVVLMDIRMPELDGLQATRRILAADETARILILTTFDLDEYVYEALRAGASGFVLKDDPPEQLLAAIRIVATGEALLSPAITKRVIENFTRIAHPEPPKELAELTDRELDVLRLIARGLSNAEIGQELYISDTTVKTHITHILQKLNLRDRVQAVVLAHETRLFATDAQPASSRDEPRVAERLAPLTQTPLEAPLREFCFARKAERRSAPDRTPGFRPEAAAGPSPGSALLSRRSTSGMPSGSSPAGRTGWSAHRSLHEGADLCLVGGGQLLQREGGRPHGAFVEVRLVAEAERRVPRFELPRALEEADALPSLAYAGIPYQVFGESAGALALMIAWSRLAMARSDPCISAIFASTALSPSALAASAFSSWARSFIAARSCP